MRYSDLGGDPEVTDLKAGTDFRLPRYRREVFLRFYEFHLLYQSHPGGVYYALPAVARAVGDEEGFWTAYVNGHTQNPVTSLRVLRAFPTLRSTAGGRLARWFEKNRATLAWDTDRRYCRKAFPDAVDAYRTITGSREGDYFRRFFEGPGDPFDALWATVRKDFPTFGRLSAFSYLEYLRILAVPLVCTTLFLDDIKGSRSHRNGLCKVLGRDDLDWHRSNPSFDGRYSREVLRRLAAEAETLLNEASKRWKNGAPNDVGYFTLESALCTFKSWFRKNRRYPSVYNDLLYDRLKRAEVYPGVDNEPLWRARAIALPSALRLEDNSWDPGCVSLKQNWFRETGEVISMDLKWTCFKNGFKRRCYESRSR